MKLAAAGLVLCGAAKLYDSIFLAPARLELQAKKDELDEVGASRSQREGLVWEASGDGSFDVSQREPSTAEESNGDAHAHVCVYLHA